jgi:23S rRNA (guanosine2251-2'-O)-methyltransferase
MTKTPERNRPGSRKSTPRPPFDREAAHRRSDPARGASSVHADDPDGPVWLWGTHAVAAALANPQRTHKRLLVTRNALARLGTVPAAISPEETDPKALDRMLPPGAVHQGVALLCEPLDGLSLDAMMESGGPVVVLDQLSDPHNLGAIWRSAAAFGVQAIVLQTRHSPPITGVVAKAAAGAVETVHEVRVVNIARTLEALTEGGWHVFGLAGEADPTLESAIRMGRDQPVAIVLGAEGEGLRPLVARHCSLLARIPIQPGMESLNASNAAAIAFYELSRKG